MENILKICDIAAMEEPARPLSRLSAAGPESLTNNELLNVIFGGKVLNNYRELDLIHMTYEEMLSSGINRATANKILALHEYSKRLWRKTITPRCFNSPDSIASYMMQEMRFLEKEELRILCLGNNCRLLSEITSTIGTVNSSLVSVREILISALSKKAVSIVLVHNHPSGGSLPSAEDIQATNCVKSGCDAIGIALKDHIIIGESSYYSFKEQGQL